MSKETTIQTRIPRSVLRVLITQHGGKFHGPNVEHLSMEEQAFWRMMDQVIDIAWKRQRVGVLK